MDYKELRKHMKHIFVMNPVSGVRNQIEETKQSIERYKKRIIYIKTKLVQNN